MTNDILKTTNLSASDVAFILDPTRPVLSHGRSMKAEGSMTPHSHPRGQFLWAEKGVLRITVKGAVWVVPPTHAIWIPSNQHHQVTSETKSMIRNLYIDPSYPIRRQEKRVIMLTMTPLLREIIIKLTDTKRTLKPHQIKHLGLIAIDELEELDPFNNYIHSGQDPRLQRLISHIVQHPNQTALLPELSNSVGASVRTIERLFKAETGMTFRQWRSRFKLMNSLTQFTEGKSSTTVAHELGYKSVSSFIATFKTQFGCTPQEYNARQ
ncbi:helix-turn-helix transcriptional regulator [Marinomonas sp.]|nr:helix-turn-helix transcriptional regulator [Marinomonas sp.]MDB4837967.1 helix-turn-helix transcriptional regulator [Marinomonas sp.]